MWEKIAFHKNKIFVILAVIVVFYWLSVTEEEYEDPYILTVDYNCREIVNDPSDIPDDIVQECKDLILNLEKQNAPKQSQRSLES
jgi:hypothetical protein